MVTETKQTQTGQPSNQVLSYPLKFCHFHRGILINFCQGGLFHPLWTIPSLPPDAKGNYHAGEGVRTSILRRAHNMSSTYQSTGHRFMLPTGQDGPCGANAIVGGSSPVRNLGQIMELPGITIVQMQR